MKSAISGLMVAILMVASVPVSAQTRERGINARQQHQQARIRDGVRQGDLTSREARRLGTEARGIRREAQAFRSDGRFTRAERQTVQRDLDRHSRNIRRERHDGDRRFAHDARRFHRDDRGRHLARGHDRGRHLARGHDMRHYRARQSWNGHWGGRPRAYGHASPIDRMQRQQHRQIVQGIRSGELTQFEARRLMAEQRAIRSQEREYRADGVLTRAERTDLYRDLNRAGRHIYNETNDAQSRR